MRRLIGVIPLPSFGIHAAVKRTRQRIDRLRHPHLPTPVCGDCGHPLAGGWIEGGRMVCTNSDCGSTYEVIRIGEEEEEPTTSGDAVRDAVLLHRKFARDYVLCLYAAVAVGTLVSILNRSMLTLAVTCAFPLALGPAALMHRYKARLLENGQGAGFPGLRALLKVAFGRGNGSRNGREH